MPGQDVAVTEAEEVAGGLCFCEALDHSRLNVPFGASDPGFTTTFRV